MISRSLRTALTFWVGLAVAHSVGHAQTVSPTEIAFYRACSNNPAKACLAVVNEDGTSLNELVDPDRYPQGISTDQGLYDTFAWSPDGTSIAFSAALTDRFGLFTVPGRGGPATFVAPGGRNPSWSPDSGRIAYAAVEPSGEWNIYVVAAAGGTPVRLTNGGDNRWPQWSADGTQISFLRSGLLQVMNADGTGLTSLAAALSPGRWSSDSARLTFTCGGFASARVSGVCAVRRDAAEFEVLTGNGEGGRAPTWSPDSTRIAFLTTSAVDGFGRTVFDVAVMNADGSSLVDFGVPALSDAQPDWSPDGSRLTFADLYSTGVSVVNADGSGWRRITDGWSPAWRPVRSIAGAPSVAGTASPAAGSTSMMTTTSDRVTAQSILASTPFGGTPAAIPGIVQAEDFDEGGENVAYFDTSPGNKGGQYRATDDVDIETTADVLGGGYDVGWTRAGEWLQYTVSIAAAGQYALATRVASNGSGGTFHVEVDGMPVTGVLAVPNTFGWQQWTDLPATVTLPAGTHVLRLVLDTIGASGGVGNFNYLRFTAAAASAPFGGTPAAVPGIVEAEDFDEGGQNVTYFDTSGGNKGGQYRTTDVDIETTADVAGGRYDVGWTRAGEWLQYTVNIAASGQYVLAARVASNGAGGTFHVELDGTPITGALSVPNTFGWQQWTDVPATVSLPIGTHVLRLVLDTVGATGGVGNFNYLAFSLVGGPWDY